MTNHLADWRWRFQNLYWINKGVDLKPCLFDPRPEQWEILEQIYERGQKRLGILKARQLGFSTLLALIVLDFLLFRPGSVIAIVDLTAKKAEDKLGKVKFALERLPADMLEQYEIETRADRIKIKLRVDNDEERVASAGKKARGDTFDLLWVSEWGPIQADDARRSDEIADGALPAADKGLVVVETTWRGGKTGRLWTEIVDPAFSVKPKNRTRRDWLINFFPWWLDPTLVWKGVYDVSKKCEDYFNDVEATGYRDPVTGEWVRIKLSKAQRLWYYKTAWPKSYRRFEEYPTTLEEMFSSPEPGAIYTAEINKLRSEHRLTVFPVDPAYRVFVSYDLGRDDAMPACFIQVIGKEIRIVDYHTTNRENIGYYANYVKDWMTRHGVNRVTIVLPHDSRHKGIAADKTVEERFEEYGEDFVRKERSIDWQVVSVGVIPSIWDGIECVRNIFPYLWINKENCTQTTKRGDVIFPSLVECLEGYHAKEMIDGRDISKQPVHDRSSHGCDSLRTFAEGYDKGLLDTRTEGRRHKPHVISGHGDAAQGFYAGAGKRKPQVRGGMS